MAAGKMHMLIFALLLSGAAKSALGATCDFSDGISLGYIPIEIVYCGDAFSTWITGTDCCSWKGVTCNSAGKVSALNIVSTIAPSGTPPSTDYLVGTGFGSLTELESLIIKKISFNGAIPPAWGTLQKLKTIDIQSCNVVGNIPEELCNAPSIETINLQNNILNGTIPPCFSDISKRGSLPFTLNVTGNVGLSY